MVLRPSLSATAPASTIKPSSLMLAIEPDRRAPETSIRAPETVMQRLRVSAMATGVSGSEEPSLGMQRWS